MRFGAFLQRARLRALLHALLRALLRRRRQRGRRSARIHRHHGGGRKLARIRVQPHALAGLERLCPCRAAAQAVQARCARAHHAA